MKFLLIYLYDVLIFLKNINELRTFKWIHEIE